MDTTTMQKLARFKIMARRLGGFNVDIFRMVQEPDHAREVLQRAQDVDSENLILLALELHSELGLADVPRVAVASRPKEPVPQPVDEGKGRYVFGARG